MLYFSIYRSFVFLGKFIFKFFILFIAMVNGIVSLISLFFIVAAAAKSHQSCPTLCDPIDGSPPGSPVPGILQARILEWVAISMKVKSESEVTQSCPALSDPIDCSLPGASFHGVFQARVLEWGAIKDPLLGMHVYYSLNYRGLD